MSYNVTVLGAGKQVQVSKHLRNVVITRNVVSAVPNPWVSPFNAATKISFDADGGITITSPVRVTVTGPTGGVVY